MVSSQAVTSAEVKGGHWFVVDGLAMPRAVGGHPGLDFVNTLAGWAEAEPSDYLKTYDHLAVWASVSGLLEADAAAALRRRAASRKAEGDAILKDAKRFRADLRALVLDPADGRALRRVNCVVGRAAARAELVPGPGPAPRWSVGGGLERPLLAVAWAASELLTQEDLSAVGACPGDGCGWVFLDPRGRRRWCSMQWCGNRSKVRAHAERHRA
ncbi:ABATE domain-containing protein [Phycicoccus sp. Root101]|uniref:CGNR zinc finger domain-containing protein n=1 Tax=Phycicoccus sp. Root101 TaxID=1736421 RepID=UPI0009E7B30F|nr:CGNR zinc finger domain-containing protein [Phycicoccus sp. Root101]